MECEIRVVVLSITGVPNSSLILNASTVKSFASCELEGSSRAIFAKRA